MKTLNIDPEGLTITMNDMLEINRILVEREKLDDARTILDAIKILIDVRTEICKK